MDSRKIYSIIMVFAKVAVLFCSFIGAQLVISLVWVVFAGLENYPESLEVSSSSLQILGGVAFVFFLRRFHKKREISFVESASLNKNRFTKVLTLKPIILLFVLYGIVMNLFVTLFLNILPAAWTAVYNETVSAQLLNDNFLIVCLSVAVYSPIVEELLFRGFAFKYLCEEIKPWIVALILSVSFGIIHMHPLWSLYAATMGMFFSWIAVRTESIIPSITAHMSFNTLSLVFVLTGDNFRWMEKLPSATVWVAFVASTVLLVASTYLIYIITGRGNIWKSYAKLPSGD